jgi:hypothetical protein
MQIEGGRRLAINLLRNQIEAHVELHTRVIDGIKSAARIGPCGRFLAARARLAKPPLGMATSRLVATSPLRAKIWLRKNAAYYVGNVTLDVRT